MADCPVRWGILGTGGIAGTFAADLRLTGSEVARRLAARETESPLMPLDETISIMETMDTVLAQARRDA